MKMPMSGGNKTAKKAPAPAAAKKPIRQVETSMSKKYKGTPKVSFKTIDDIKKMGMTAALKKAGTSKNPEYLEGIKRMYGAKRLAAAQGATSGRNGGTPKAVAAAKKAALGMGPAKKAAAPAANKSAAGARSGSEYQQALASQSKSSKKKSNGYFDSLAKNKSRSGGRKNAPGGR